MRWAARAHDRAEQCRKVVDADGPTIVDRFQQLKAHPLLQEESQQRDLVRRAVATLGFRDEEPIGGRS